MFVFTIGSVKYNEWMYAEEDNYAFDAQRRRFLTYRSKSIPNNREWKIEPKYHQPDVMRIRNVNFEELLFADPNVSHDKHVSSPNE